MLPNVGKQNYSNQTAGDPGSCTCLQRHIAGPRVKKMTNILHELVCVVMNPWSTLA